MLLNFLYGVAKITIYLYNHVFNLQCADFDLLLMKQFI